MKPVTLAQIGALILLTLFGVVATAEDAAVPCPTLAHDQACDL